MRFGEGFVEEIKENGLAKVRVSRDSLYVACSVCAAADHVKLLAYNSIGAAEGDHPADRGRDPGRSGTDCEHGDR